MKNSCGSLNQLGTGQTDMQSFYKNSIQHKLHQFKNFCASRQMKHAIKTAIAAIICLIIYKSEHLPKGYWAVITAIIVMQSTADTGSLESTFHLAWQRLVGTMLGAIVGLSIHVIFTPNYFELVFIIFLLIIVGVCITYFFPGMKMVGITAVLVILVSGHQPMTQNIAFIRAIEILLGAFIALFVSVTIWPQRMHQYLYQNYLKHMGVILKQFNKVETAFRVRSNITPSDNNVINNLLSQIDSERHHLDHLAKSRRRMISNLLSWQIRLLKNIKLIYKNIGQLPENYFENQSLMSQTEQVLELIHQRLILITSGTIKIEDETATHTIIEAYNLCIEQYRLNKRFQRFSMNESYAVATIAMAANKLVDLTSEIIDSLENNRLK